MIPVLLLHTSEYIEEMTEAPEQGYRPILVIPVEKNSGGSLFAYVKNDGGLFYSKIRVNYANRSNRDHVELRWGYYTNATGERGLEFSDNIYSQYLRDERAGLREPALRKQLLMGEVVAPMIEKK